MPAKALVNISLREFEFFQMPYKNWLKNNQNVLILSQFEYWWHLLYSLINLYDKIQFIASLFRNARVDFLSSKLFEGGWSC